MPSVIGLQPQQYFTHQEYPKNIYDVDGKTYRVVNSKEEEDAALDGDRKVTDSESEADQRSALMAQAAEKNIKVDGRWSIDRLRQEVSKT